MDQTQTNKNNISVPLAIVLAGAMIAGAVYLGGRTPLPEGRNLAKTELPDIESVGSADKIFGNKEAQVIVVEYSDLECPFCKVFHNTMHQIVDEYKGKIAWVYRHYPIKELHTRATREAEASECAYEQGGSVIFWKYIDQVFATTGTNDTLDPLELPKIAGSLGLNTEVFNTCLNTGKYAAKVQEDVKKAVEAGARGTPYSVILKNGVEVDTINGAEPLTSIKIKLDKALSN